MKNSYKSGVSLIAVLLFMLAATTASIVVFRWISQENFSSGSRLKQSEAQQASQAGLEAVQGWLTNKGADAGALVRVFELGNQNPVRMVSSVNNTQTVDLLGSMQSKREQKYDVYLTGVNTNAQPYQFKFLSVGTARDGSKHSQVGIFSVEGLHRMKVDGGTTTPSSGKANKVPPFHGAMNSLTQSAIIEAANIIGNYTSTSGFGSKGDVIITGKANVTGTASAGAGCGTYSHDANNYTSRPAAFETLLENGEIGNTYVKEDWESQNQAFCGNVYVGGNFTSKSGNISVWGDLYVGGTLDAGNKKLTVQGNLTVDCIKSYTDENIDIRGSLVIKNVGCGAWAPTKIGNSCTKAVCGQIWEARNNPAGATPPSNLVANTLDYLGDQITTSKVNGKYTIPDPIILGFADGWKTTVLPSDASCATLIGMATNNVITINSGTIASSFMTAINNCHSNGAIGNWTGADGTKWLVIRMSWGGINSFQDQTFKGNFIIVVENDPGSNLRLPKTETSSNVLLWLTKGASGTIFISQGTRNYFIYSEQNIKEINGNQYLTGNIFMKDGAAVETMQDPRIQANDAMFDALSNAGVIKDNEFKCLGTKRADSQGRCPAEDPADTDTETGDTPPPPPPPPVIEVPTGTTDPAYSFVPTVPHLKVKLQSQYSNEEIPTGNINARPAILVMPRVIYLEKDQINTDGELNNYFNALYLNGANPVAKTAWPINAVGNCGGIAAAEVGHSRICYLNLSGFGAANCNNSDLCNNAFYVIITPKGSTVNSSSSTGGSDIPAGTPSSSSRSSSSVTQSSPSQVGSCTYTAKGKLSSGETINHTCQNGYTFYFFQTGSGSDSNPNGSSGSSRTVEVTGNGCSISTGVSHTWHSCTPNNSILTIKNIHATSSVYCLNVACCPSGLSPISVPSQNTNPVPAPFNCTAGGTSSSSSAPPSSSSSAPPTITCTVAKTNVTQGENIAPPTISCSNGATMDKSQANFAVSAGTLPNNYNNWRQTGNAYFLGSVDGNNIITVSNVTCGGVAPSNLPKECGTIVVNKPTCTLGKSSYAVNEIITPTVSCGTAQLGGHRSFSNGTNWTNTATTNNTSGKFTSAGNNLTLSVTNITCDSHALTYSNLACTPNVNVVAASSSSVTPSSSSSSSGSGGGPGTIAESDANQSSFPVGNYTVTITRTSIYGPSTFKCYITSNSSASPTTVGTYTPSGGTAVNITFPAHNTQTGTISSGMGTSALSTTGTFNITVAGVTCKVTN